MPKTSERFCAGTRLASAAMTMPNEPEATPRPTRTPPPICSQNGVGAQAIITRPEA